MNKDSLGSTWRALDGSEDALAHLVVGPARPLLPTVHAVETAATAAVGASALAANAVWRARTGSWQTVTIDPRHATIAFRSEHHVRVGDGGPAQLWSLFSRFYRTRDDRFLQLHANFRHHLERALVVLDASRNLDDVTETISERDGAALEQELADAGACAALVRSRDEWLAHPQGMAVGGLPLLDMLPLADARTTFGAATRPLAGVRVVDLTRVIAGPVCTRTLAAHGADVTRVIASHLPEVDVLLPDTTLGKRTALLDLRASDDREAFAALVRDADVFVQSYRPDALAALGWGPDDVASIRPGIVYVSLSAYSHAGPWHDRRGYDSLVQSATGIAKAEGDAFAADRPQHLPSAALDHATGYLAAAATMLALAAGGARHVRCSLAQTREWLDGLGRVDHRTIEAPEQDDVADLLEVETEYGRVTHVRPAGMLSETPPRW